MKSTPPKSPPKPTPDKKNGMAKLNANTKKGYTPQKAKVRP